MAGAKPVVSIVRFKENRPYLKNGLDSITGLGGLNPGDRVLIKPNVGWGSSSKKIPLYGFATTSRVIEDLVIILKEMGCRHITIGEGAIPHAELGSNTHKAFQLAGYTKIAKRYGVRLLDFNEGPHKTFDLGGVPVAVAREALESDFLINVPVLKTHCFTRITLGFKNLKGCLSNESKKDFHRKGLDEMIARLNTLLRPSLTIIDGIYAMEKGPEAFTGIAHRRNCIIAGTDPLACDIVGTAVMGFDPEEIEHLARYASLSGRENILRLSEIEVRGNSIQDVLFPLPWERNYDDFFSNNRITGITLKDPGSHLCSGCAAPFKAALVSYCKDNTGAAVKNTEICLGPDIHPEPGSQKIILIGACSMKANKKYCENNAGVITVPGCPPSTKDILLRLLFNTRSAGKARRVILLRLLKKIATRLGIYDEDFGIAKKYTYPEFDPDHF
ncbi:MAG: DUF362 domain-containing protein [bacterium]|nr:DUF362 domain-containing protein [bacterium]